MKKHGVIFILLAALLINPARISSDENAVSHKLSLFVQPVRILHFKHSKTTEYEEQGNAITEKYFIYGITWICSPGTARGLIVRKSPVLQQEINVSFRLTRNNGPDLDWTPLGSDDIFIAVSSSEKGQIICRFSYPKTLDYIPLADDIQVILSPVDYY